jgi:hypothetical protein
VLTPDSWREEVDVARVGAETRLAGAGTRLNKNKNRKLHTGKNNKNKVQSFYITKERKASRTISKLVKEDGQEITQPAQIVQELQEDRFCDTVGQTFELSARLEDFLKQHGVVLPEVSEVQRDSLDQEFMYQDIKKALGNSKGTAPGPTGQTASLYKYIFSMIPNTFVRALNELAFVPGLITRQHLCG